MPSGVWSRLLLLSGLSGQAERAVLSFLWRPQSEGERDLCHTLAPVPRVVLGTEIKVTVGERGRRREGRCRCYAGPVVAVRGREGKIA